MKKYYPLTGVFWIVLSIYVVVTSYNLNLGGFHEPGPGFLPFIIGILLFLASSYSLIKWLIEKNTGAESPKNSLDRKIYLKIGLVLVSLLAYAFYVEKLGYLIASCLVLILLLRTMSQKRWPFILSTSIVVSLVTYFGFSFLG